MDLPKRSKKHVPYKNCVLVGQVSESFRQINYPIKSIEGKIRNVPKRDKIVENYLNSNQLTRRSVCSTLSTVITRLGAGKSAILMHENFKLKYCKHKFSG